VAASPNQRLSYGAIAGAGGGVILIISLFIDWFPGGNAWDALSFTPFVLLVIGLLAIFLAVLELPSVNVQLPVDRARTMTIAGIVATSIVWAFIFDIPGGSKSFGIYLSGLMALAILAGGILLERAPHLGVAMGGGGPAAYAGGQPGGIGQGGYGQPPGGAYAQQPPAYAQPPAAAQAPAAAEAPTAFEQPVAQSSPPPPDRPGTPADWYPDPKGEKRLRYWDGSQWTEHVAD
jgi:hypothetical protein